MPGLDLGSHQLAHLLRGMYAANIPWRHPALFGVVAGDGLGVFAVFIYEQQDVLLGLGGQRPRKEEGQEEQPTCFHTTKDREFEDLAFEVSLGTRPGLAGAVVWVGTLLAITVVTWIVVGVEKHRLNVIEDRTQQLSPVQNLERLFDGGEGRLAPPHYQQQSIAQSQDNPGIRDRRE